jgi:hypothetical protein
MRKRGGLPATHWKLCRALNRLCAPAGPPTAGSALQRDDAFNPQLLSIGLLRSVDKKRAGEKNWHLFGWLPL